MEQPTYIPLTKQLSSKLKRNFGLGNVKQATCNIKISPVLEAIYIK